MKQYSFNELTRQAIESVTFYQGYYYVRLKPESEYENVIWKVDDKTHKVEPMFFTEYLIGVHGNARPIEISAFRNLK